MLDQVLEEQKLTVDFSGKIDVVYTNLIETFEAPSTHVKKLQTQLGQTSEAVRRHVALIKGKCEAEQMHHVSDIIDDDFWQVARRQFSNRKFYVDSWCTLVSLDTILGAPIDTL